MMIVKHEVKMHIFNVDLFLSEEDIFSSSLCSLTVCIAKCVNALSIAIVEQLHINALLLRFKTATDESNFT